MCPISVIAIISLIIDHKYDKNKESNFVRSKWTRSEQGARS